MNVIEINERFNMTCPLCGPNILCYEECYGENSEAPFMIRFIGHENSTAFILFEMIINKDKNENDITSRSLRCSHCYSLVIVRNLHLEWISENYHLE